MCLSHRGVAGLLVVSRRGGLVLSRGGLLDPLQDGSVEQRGGLVGKDIE